ncbi:MAG: MBL fold metallo-hydrolase [Clostridia bacterium]|nr:MBL fold metallo-hydrolase [Clostridia bacterium]
MFRFGEMYEKLDSIKKMPWLGKMDPFRIIGNVYFVGTYQASCHLIDTGEGLIMIDPGYSSTAYLVIDSIHKLGFKPTDIKYIFNTHWHGDHVEATAAFADLFGAKTILGRDDVEKAARYFTPDIIIDDGYTLELGNTVIRFVHTPGHTKGTFSFFFDTVEGGKSYRVGSFGGAGVNTLVLGRFDFDGCREAYRASLNKLRSEKVDVFIGNHTWNNDTYGKSLALGEGKENPFVDPELGCKFLDSCESRLMKTIEDDKKQLSYERN